MRRKAKRWKGSSDYHIAALKGTVGEVALHLCAKALQLPSRIILPSSTAQPVDNRIVLAKELLFQTKAIGLKAGNTLYDVPNNFRLRVDACDHADYYAWALIHAHELFCEAAYVTVDLLPFAPIDFVKKHATVHGRLGRSVALHDLRDNAEVTLSHKDLDRHRILPAEIPIDEESFAKLTSATVDERLQTALLAIDSPVDASRVHDLLNTDGALRKAFGALAVDHLPVQPAGVTSAVALSSTSEVA